MPSGYQPLFGRWYLTVGGKKMQELARAESPGDDARFLTPESLIKDHSYSGLSEGQGLGFLVPS